MKDKIEERDRLEKMRSSIIKRQYITYMTEEEAEQLREQEEKQKGKHSE